MIVQALISLRPGAQWTLDGETYDGLSWLDKTQTKPTKKQVDDEMARLKAEYDANQYQRSRASEYPPIADQLDMIFHGGIDQWKAAIQQIKDKYPKPE